MIYRSFYFLLLCLLVPSFSIAQITAFQAKTYQDSAGNKLQYRMLMPTDYDTTKKYPLVLFLHGADERGQDNVSQLKWGISNFAEPEFRKQYPAFVAAPQVPKGQSWSTLKSIRDSTSYSVPMRAQPTEPMRLTIELLAKLQRKFSINSNRLYVTGISMGGFGTFDLIERHPNKFAAAVPIAGGGDATRAFFFKDMPIWVFHGANDEIISPKYSRNMVSAIRVAGGSPGYTEYPGQGHQGAWIKAYNNPHLYEWMFSQQLAEKGQ